MLLLVQGGVLTLRFCVLIESSALGETSELSPFNGVSYSGYPRISRSVAYTC